MSVAAHRRPVAPVTGETERPLWSVMIPAFDCARYLSATLASVLAEDPGPSRMQIEVVDDHSSDDPEAVVRELGGGRVRFFRQPANRGTIGNFQTCLERSRGRLIHLLHGDDCIRPGFYAALERGFAAAPEIGAAFCRHIYIDAEGAQLGRGDPLQAASGVLADALQCLASEQRIMTPAIVVRREVYESLGGFDDRLKCAEDWEMWVRIAARYAIWYEAEPLACYRMHASSNTGRNVRSAADMAFTRRAIDIFAGDLEGPEAREIVRRARKTYALAAIRGARALIERNDRIGAVAQLREALRLNRSPDVLAAAARLLARSVRRRPKAGRP